MSDTAKPPVPTRISTQPLGRVESMQALFDHPDFKRRIMEAAPKHMSADRLLRTFSTAVQKTPKLMKVSPISMLGAFITLASLGLEPNTPLQHAFLIPFDENKWNPKTREREILRTNVNLIIGYPGYIDLIYRSGRVKDIHCDVVWKGDDFSYEYGSNAHLRHKPVPRRHEANEEPTHAYMHARLADGGEMFEVMTAADVLHIRGRSQGFRTAMAAFDRAQGDGKKPPMAYTEAPWIKDPIPMWRKTALRAGQKWLPKSIELAAAVALDEIGDRGRVDFSKVIDSGTVLDGSWEQPDDGTDDDVVAPGPISPPPAQPAPQASHPLPSPAPAPRPRTPAAPAPVTTLAFSGYLTNADGEVAESEGQSGHFADPVQWAKAYAALHDAGTSEDRDALAENNESEKAAARRFPEAARILADLTAPPAAPDPLAAIEIPRKANGTPDFNAYISALRRAAEAVPEAGRPAWAAQQAATVATLPTTARRNAEKVLAPSAAPAGPVVAPAPAADDGPPPDDIPLPEDERGSVAPRVAPAGPVDEDDGFGAWAPPADEGVAPEPVEDPQRTQDLAWAAGIKRDIAAAETDDDVTTLGRNEAVSRRIQQVKDRHPDIVQQIQDAASERRAAIRSKRGAAT